MNIHLEGIVNASALIQDLRKLLDGKHFVRPDILHHIVLDFRVLEMKEMPGIVPDKTILSDGLAIPAHLIVGFQYQILMGRFCRKAQSGDAGAYDDVNRFQFTRCFA